MKIWIAQTMVFTIFTNIINFRNHSNMHVEKHIFVVSLFLLQYMNKYKIRE